jgi:hypothetical protein
MYVDVPGLRVWLLLDGEAPDAGRTGGEAAAGEPDAADAEATPGEMNLGHLMTGTTRALRSG